jgi:FkbM family methyltransferase
MHAYFWSLLARRRLQPFWEAAYKVVVRGMGYNNYAPEWNGEYRVLAQVLAEIGHTRPVVFDVGANEGDFTARVLELCPDAEVHAFEPNPPTYARLERQFAHRPQVHLHALGLSEKETVLQLADYADADGSSHASFLPAGIASIQPPGRGTAEPTLAFTPVPVATLDGIVARRGIETIDYLKLDVEGYERSVLLGAREAIAARRCRNIQIEINAHNAVIGASLHQLAALLPGYEIYKILPAGLYRVELNVLHDMFRYATFLFREPGSAAAGKRAAPTRAPVSAGTAGWSEVKCAASVKAAYAASRQRS